MSSANDAKPACAQERVGKRRRNGVGRVTSQGRGGQQLEGDAAYPPVEVDDLEVLQQLLARRKLLLDELDELYRTLGLEHRLQVGD